MSAISRAGPGLNHRHHKAALYRIGSHQGEVLLDWRGKTDRRFPFYLHYSRLACLSYQGSDAAGMDEEMEKEEEEKENR
ncbi:hypothetical protein E2C01_057349 [Portunus trituberculatus]|uniref:Uncharacterized protein n=1 Tax=Portunus trituberculatus TaxID=210409 RepID=A0A5B7H343_PORTR|nr:hypothetical protein [Portunus trituberculatus]